MSAHNELRGMMAKFPSVAPTLRSRRLVLRAPHETDIDGWFLRASDKESASLAGDPVAESVSEGEAWLARSRARTAAGTRIQWCIDCPDDAWNVGTVAVSTGSSELSFVIGRPYWNCGFATEAARLALGYGFQNLDVSEVAAEVVSHNIGSLRVLAKLGFKKQSTFVDPTDGEICERHTLSAEQF